MKEEKLNEIRTHYEHHLNECSPDHESEKWVIGGKRRKAFAYESLYGSALRRFDPVAFETGFQNDFLPQHKDTPDQMTKNVLLKITGTLSDSGIVILHERFQIMQDRQSTIVIKVDNLSNRQIKKNDYKVIFSHLGNRHDENSIKNDGSVIKYYTYCTPQQVGECEQLIIDHIFNKIEVIKKRVDRLYELRNLNPIVKR